MPQFIGLEPPCPANAPVQARWAHAQRAGPPPPNTPTVACNRLLGGFAWDNRTASCCARVELGHEPPASLVEIAVVDCREHPTQHRDPKPFSNYYPRQPCPAIIESFEPMIVVDSQP